MFSLPAVTGEVHEEKGNLVGLKIFILKRIIYTIILVFSVISINFAIFMLITSFVAADTYTSEVQEFRAERLQRLKSDDGWLSLVGLFWLKESENTLGSDPSSDVVFPKDRAPAHVGSISLANGTIRLKPAKDSGILINGKPATSQALQSDEEGRTKPTQMTISSLIFYVIQRADKHAVRVKDKKSPAIQNFAGLDYFLINPKWRLEAKFQPYNPPKNIPIVNILGMVEDNASPGAVIFDIDGKSYRLDTLPNSGEPGLSLIFSDKTSGKETYGAGRYLDIDAPSQGKVVVDFNKAYSPPCAFTHFATCPLPPPQNKLPVRIEAGEKAPKELLVSSP